MSCPNEFSGEGSTSGRKGRGKRPKTDNIQDNPSLKERDRRPSPERGIVILEDIQLVPPRDELGIENDIDAANRQEEYQDQDIYPMVSINTTAEQCIGRVRTRGGRRGTVRVRTRGGGAIGRVRTRGGRSTESVRARSTRGKVGVRGSTVRTRSGRRGVGERRALDDASLHTFYKSILPGVKPFEGTYDSLIYGERLETPMHLKKPRLWPATVVSESSSSNAAEASTSSSVPSPVLSMPSPVRLMPSPVQSVPSPAQFIECESTRSNTPSSSQEETNVTQLFTSTRHCPLTDLEIGRFLNNGSEEESDSEDEQLSNCVSRIIENSQFNIDDENECVETSSISPTIAEQVKIGERERPLSSERPQSLATMEESINYSTPCGPERFLFNWSNFPETPIPPRERREVFTGVGGPSASFRNPEEAFTAIWDREIMDLIVAETNRYAEEEINKCQTAIGPHSRVQRWTPTDVNEIYVFFGVLLAMGQCVKSNIKEYWQCTGLIYDTPNFAKYISYNRYVLLTKFLHFARNIPAISALSLPEAKIHKIQPIASHLNKKFQSLYSLRQNICIDESLTQWKGWLSINQFIKNKAASIGVKTYEVCDAKTGYLWRFEICSGRKERADEPNPLSGVIATLVLRLLSGLENRGHCVWMDNFYNSPALARTLKTMGFDCVGTLRPNRQFVPPQLASLKKNNMVAGEIQGCTSGDVDILVWRDQNKVSMISTYHGNAVQTMDGKTKPIVVLDYNLCMGGVDRKDQKLAMFPLERKRTKVWYKKLFRRLLNVSVLNSFILYTESSVPEHPEPRYTTHRSFREELIRRLLNMKDKAPVNVITETSAGPTIFSEDYFNHLPKEYDALPGRGKEKLRRVCAVCHKRTHTYCPGCNATLCVFTCFAPYHRRVT